MDFYRDDFPAYALNAKQSRDCDEYTQRVSGVDGLTLMERAARACVAFLTGRTDLFPVSSGRILVLCGSGNNGGDGFAVARILTGECGKVCTVLYSGAVTGGGMPDTDRMSAACAEQYRRASLLSVTTVPLESEDRDDVPVDFSRYDALIDGLFGTGLSRPVSERSGLLFDNVRRSGIPVLAIDMPSGIDAGTGDILGYALPAKATVTMQALKRGQLLYPGADFCGELCVADVGISLAPVTKRADTDSRVPTAGPSRPDDTDVMRVPNEKLLQKLMPPRNRRTHKGVYGSLGLVCGGSGMAGAAAFAALSAVRTGAGLVKVFTAPQNRAVLQTLVPEAIVTSPDSPDGIIQSVSLAVSGFDGCVIGCGLSQSKPALSVLNAVLDAVSGKDGLFPLVLDADALNLLAKNPALWQKPALSSPRSRVILTPHPAEMSRLCGTPVKDILKNPVTVARDFAREHGVAVVLKDAHTIIADPDGQVWICPFGNAGMARGGFGDVLSGIVGSMAVQNLSRLNRGETTVGEIAAAAVYLHAKCGDAAAENVGEYALTPRDLIDAVAGVTRCLSDSRTRISSISSF